MGKVLVALPPDAPLIKRWWQAIRIFNQLRRDVTDPYWGPMFVETLDGPCYAKHARAMRSCDAGRQLLDRQPSLAASDLDFAALAALAESTLGGAFARYFNNWGFKPIDSRPDDLDDVRYLAKRVRESHDLHHILTGYGVDDVGEHELQAFQYGNLKSPTSLFTMFFVLVFFYRKQPLPRLPYLRRLHAAWKRGRRAPPMIAIPWEEHWHDDLAAVRSRHLGSAAR